MLKFSGLKVILTFDNWLTIIFARLFDRRSGFVVYRKNGFDILIDHRGGDENGTRACIATDMYRKYLPCFVFPRAIRVLDLGANGGGFPLMLSIEGVKLAQVVCVEMNPLTYLRLQLNLITNLGSLAVAINAAVCGMPQNTEILLKPSRGGTSESIYANQSDSVRPHVAVRTTTLRALYDQYFEHEVIDICKIDIEGAEYELFTSAPDDVLQKIRYLIIEFHDPSQTPILLNRILALGFVEITIPEGHKTGDKTEVRVFRGPGDSSASV